MKRLVRRLWVALTWPLRRVARFDTVVEAEIVRMRSAAW